MTTHADDCAEQPHTHVALCQRAGYANGLRDSVAAAIRDAARIAQLEADLAAAEAKLAAVEALADADEKARSLCASDPDCPCAYKDCYECGKWHACTHTPYVAIRAALATQPAP